MMRNRENSDINIWPGFVDALSSVLIVMLFVFTVFIVSQFYLSQTVAIKSAAIKSLEKKMHSVEGILDKEKGEKKNIKRELLEFQHCILRLEEEKRLIEQEAEMLRQKLALALGENDKMAKNEESLRLTIGDLKEKTQKLDEKLQAALAARVKELTAYKSEFFGKLKEALRNRKDIKIVGDRFILQSEVLFEQGSADLGSDGKNKLQEIAKAIKGIIKTIPEEISWVLRVDGHTDDLPIKSGSRFASNWDLSTARAVSVVRFLIQQGMPEKNIAGAGFAEFHPLAKGKSNEQRKQNRRIELIFDQKAPYERQK
ncbi:OmpA family protein [Candidatus Hydrogenosomobacter endosymbioticus]|uniref:OmpA-like domain-containing protein n=1 Tax=Candidatus Hydrogenosomobacter endosymbioticus TaxID=2558174 RepID=A0ABM7V991_9PROT|nr:OmpA family protein [Candidatus Hydrogenosomobacter endosymbioticus]BDB96359.1 hypothetical protein HYD_4920 [Candidatus Hydrogenosomobacter endosymbioticus]